MAHDFKHGGWTTAPDGTRRWDPTAGPPPRVKKPRAPRAAKVRKPGEVDRWAKGTWKWSTDAEGNRVRVPLSAEDRAARETAAKEKTDRRARIDALLDHFAGRVGDETPMWIGEGPLEVRPESIGRVVLEVDRGRATKLVVQGRTWVDGKTGEVSAYVGVFTRFEFQGKPFRTKGAAIRHGELRAVIDALESELRRLDAGDFDPPHVPADPEPADG